MKNLFVLTLLIFSFCFAANAQAPQAGKTYYVQSALSSSLYFAPNLDGTNLTI